MTEQRPLVPEDLDERETERRCANEREMRQAPQVEVRSEGWDSWNAWADGCIAAALKQHEKLFTEAVGEALGEICEGLGNEFRKELQAATGKLGVELRELNAGLRTELARHETELARRSSQALTMETGGLHLRGMYRSDQDYDRLDVVTLEGSSYMARCGSPGSCPGEGWRILASAGATGPQGPRGPKGEPGPRGLTGEAGPKAASGAVIVGWSPDYAGFKATPIMSDGSEGSALDLRPFFQVFLDQTQRQ
jgi:hypothetical protein